MKTGSTLPLTKLENESELQRTLNILRYPFFLSLYSKTKKMKLRKGNIKSMDDPYCLPDCNFGHHPQNWPLSQAARVPKPFAIALPSHMH